MITFEDFQKLDIRIGKIISAEKVPETDKLLKLVFDFGNEQRQVISGIAETYKPEDLIGMQMPVLINLEPKTFKGLESQGMILAIDEDNKTALLNPNFKVSLGAKIS